VENGGGNLMKNRGTEGEQVVYEGKTFEIVRKVMQGKGKTVTIEMARRSPGVRLIIVRGDNVLLTREYRYELNGYDYRLPGGKVFDSLKEYQEALKAKKDISECAEEAAKLECAEETGLIAREVRHIHTSVAGLTIQWDLFYFVVDDFTQGEQKPEDAEIIHPEWKTFDEAKQLCLEGKMSEDRSVGVLLRFLGKGYHPEQKKRY